MNSLTKSEKKKGFMAPKMTDLVTFIDTKGKYALYDGGDIHGIYRYLEIIGAPTTLTTSGHRSHHLGPSYCSNNDAATLQSVIASLCMRQKSICECCGIIGHKSDSCIIRGPKFLPPSLRRNINQFNTLHSDKPKEPRTLHISALIISDPHLAEKMMQKLSS